MARISGADPSKQGLLSGLLTRIVYGLTKRKLGRLVMPVRIAAHHSKILWGYGQMEQSLLGCQLVDAGLKDLAQLRVGSTHGEEEGYGRQREHNEVGTQEPKL
jgi:hypothetical protein